MKNMDFEVCFKKYHDYTVETARRILRNSEEAEKTAEDVFHYLYERRDELDFSDERKLRALIFTAVVNKTKEYVK